MTRTAALLALPLLALPLLTIAPASAQTLAATPGSAQSLVHFDSPGLQTAKVTQIQYRHRHRRYRRHHH